MWEVGRGMMGSPPEVLCAQKVTHMWPAQGCAEGITGVPGPKGGRPGCSWAPMWGSFPMTLMGSHLASGEDGKGGCVFEEFSLCSGPIIYIKH